MTAYRYWRFRLVRYIGYYGPVVAGTGGGQGPTRLVGLRFALDGEFEPTPYFTSPYEGDSGQPYVVTGSGNYDESSTGAPAIFMDRSSYSVGDSGGWITSGSTGVPWVTIDFNTPREFDTVYCLASGGEGTPLDFDILASNTGVFGGEEYVALSFVSAGDAAVEMGAAAPGYAVFPLAAPEVAAGINGVASSLPRLGMAASGSSMLSAQLPMLDAFAQGSTGILTGVDAVLPGLAAVALGGANTSAELPALRGFATATFYGWSQTAATLPALRATASGTVGSTASGTAALPMLAASSRGGGTAAAVLPALSAVSGSTAGSTAAVDVRLPRLALGLTASTGNVGRVAAMLPALRVGDSGVLRATLPALSALVLAYETATYTYEAYSVNLNHRPSDRQPVDEVTRYTNYPFDKIVRYRNSYFGVAADGLYLLGGTTDNGAPIEWSIQTAIDDFGSPQKKTLVSTYLSGRVGHTATVDLFIGEKGAETYSYASPRGPDIQNFRQKFGRGVKARYFALGLSGTEEFQLDTLDFETLVLSRRI